MTDVTIPAWWDEAEHTAADRPELVAGIRDARITAASAGTTLAKWKAHRASCPRCEAVRPPAGPAQCCYKGSKLLDAWLRVAERYRAALGLLATYRLQAPGRLF